MLIFELILLNLLSVLTPEALLEKIDSARMPNTYEVTFRINNHIPPDRNIEYHIKALVKKDKGSLLEFTYPAREKGRKFLLVEDNLWMYVPGMSQTIRLSPKDNFMGTDLSNKDMMQSHFAEDYKPVKYDSTEAGFLLYLEANNPTIPYKRIEVEVNGKDFVPRKIRYYTLSGKLFRSMTLDSVKTFGTEKYPSYMKMENLLTESSYTEVFIESLKKKSNIPDRLFNPLNLKK